MFIRKGFITNSSSTSFICYGIRLNEDIIDAKFSKSSDYYERHEQLDQTLSEVYQTLKAEGSPVRLFWNGEMSRFLLYIEASYLYLDECGLIEFPAQKVEELLLTSKEPNWAKALEEAKQKLGLETWEQPKWHIALSIER